MEKKLHIGHGDGLGPGDKGYKFIKKVFSSTNKPMVIQMVTSRFGNQTRRFLSHPEAGQKPEKKKMFFLGKRMADYLF
jgi:hypothetical protein